MPSFVTEKTGQLVCNFKRKPIVEFCPQQLYIKLVISKYHEAAIELIHSCL